MTSPSILDGFAKETDFAAANNISTKTCARYRMAGLPHLVWGGCVYINLNAARDWLLARTQRRNTRRTAMA
jgi:hypothetical protein